MKIIAPFLLLTGVIWIYGLQSPEESDPAVSYASTLSQNTSQAAFSKSVTQNKQVHSGMTKATFSLDETSYPLQQQAQPDSSLKKNL
ncbi:hypothetical protein HUW51_18915 [Adhaeribacter swui]|uniref:Uncharacterized protein n=1 Tax=Adhaeribacter swui TaxID=2086471 RepID=A0A7G7GC13_9BACT|nr:hypothetical protein [Adhaeribacter swui]QNF34697.1 hypothetical protein HUW51_18915 [Adhaeribacter swui]